MPAFQKIVTATQAFSKRPNVNMGRLEMVAVSALVVVTAAFFLADIWTLPMRLWD